MTRDTPGLWAVTAPDFPALTPLEGRIEADLAIVGAGYTGLSAALEAAMAGARVVVLDAEGVGAGGSGRNVGLVNAGLWLMPDEVEARLGAESGLLELLSAAPAAVWETVERHGIDCEARPAGTLHCATDAAGMQALEERARQWQGRQVAVALLDAAQARARTGTDRYLGALFDPRAGTIQPLGYARGLACAAMKAGAVIHAPARVTGARAQGRGWEVETERGKVGAARLIWAGNAYGTGPAANDSLTIMPYFNFATDPLPDDLRRSILPGGEGAWDTATVLTSFRLDAAGRFVIGSVGELGRADTAVHEAWASRQMRRLFPQLAGIPFAHRWFGRIGTTPDAVPRMVQTGPGAYGVTGFNGRGIGPGTVLGRELARTALDLQSALPVLPVAKPDPLRKVRGAGYRLGAAALHLADRRR